MNSILLFAGTTEGREIAEALTGAPVTVTVSVATEYGETLIAPAGNVHVLHGRKNAEQIEALLKETGAELLIDATHPYAVEVTETLKAVSERTETEYLRVVRGSQDAEDCIYAADTSEAVTYLNGTQGNVLLTVGSKELARYTEVKDFETRLFARILPVKESADAAFALGFTGKHLICMQGPFSEALNEAMLRAVDAKYLVTKDTGAAGGFAEKIRAARASGVTPIVIRRPEEEGITEADCLRLLSKRYGIRTKKQVTVLGVGTGSDGMLTEAAKTAIRSADLLIGAKRVTDALKAYGKPVRNAIASAEIERVIRDGTEKRIVVAMSGDTGFFSGTKTLLERIGDLSPEVLPGISSIVYLAAKCRTPWDDAALASAHGRDANTVALVKRNPKLFLLTGGKTGVSAILKELAEYGLGDVRATVGENLSYADERITTGTAAELSERTFDPLSVLLVENPKAEPAAVRGRRDEDFLRTEVPMTKSEVRAVTLSKLNLNNDAICWDVGAGTGSVSIEMAEAAEKGTVYAIEKKADACALIERNKRHLGVSNVTVIEGTAPQALSDLPAPTHVFIGGSGGNLREIMETALKKNPRVRIVVNTVTAETFAETVTALKTLPVGDAEIVELAVSRGRKIGSYHLMTAQNPVYIISCEGVGTDA